MATKTKEKKFEAVPFWTLEDAIGPDRAEVFGKRLDAAEQRRQRAQEELQAADEEERFIDRQAREAMRLFKSMDVLAPVLAMRPWDDALRSILPRMKLKGRDRWDPKLHRYVPVEFKDVRPWEELKDGATDAQISTNLTKGFQDQGGEATSGNYILRGGELRRGKYWSEAKPVAKGKDLVAAVRRVLGIPVPPAKAPVKKAAAASKAKTKPAAAKAPAKEKSKGGVGFRPQTFGQWLGTLKGIVGKGVKIDEAAVRKYFDQGKRPADVKKILADDVAGDDVQDLEDEGDVADQGGAVAPPAPAAARPTAPFQDWARAVKKAMKRRGEKDPMAPTAVPPWFDWFEQGVKASDAADRFLKGELVGALKEPAAAGDANAPGPRVVTADPRGTVGDADIVYDTFDLGIGAGEIAAADQTQVLAATDGELTAVVKIPGDAVPYAVLRHESEAYDQFRLYPVFPRGTVVPVVSKAKDPYAGRVCQSGGTEVRLGAFDDGGIRVKDEGAGAKASKPRLIDTIDDEAETPAGACVAVVDSLPDPDDQGVIRDHGFARDDLERAYVEDVLETGKVAHWVVACGQAYAVVNMADIKRGQVTRWHLHPLVKPDEWSGPREPWATRTMGGRRPELPGMVVELAGGDEAVLGEASKRLILETPGPKGGK